jgi:magnesium transporter
MTQKLKKHRRSDKAGLPPGSLIHVGEKKMGDVALHLMRYGDKVFMIYSDIL